MATLNAIVGGVAPSPALQQSAHMPPNYKAGRQGKRGALLPFIYCYFSSLGYLKITVVKKHMFTEVFQTIQNYME